MRCPNCGKELEVIFEHAGPKLYSCKECKKEIWIDSEKESDIWVKRIMEKSEAW